MKYSLYALVLVGLAYGTAPEEAFSEAVIITMEYWSPYYQPSEAVTSYGNVLYVINKTSSAHTIRYDQCIVNHKCLFDTGIVRPEDTISLPPLPPGVYHYHCELHPIMRGTIIVKMPEESGRD